MQLSNLRFGSLSKISEAKLSPANWQQLICILVSYMYVYMNLVSYIKSQFFVINFSILIIISSSFILSVVGKSVSTEQPCIMLALMCSNQG